MDFTKIILKALSIKGIQEFFTVYDEEGNLSKDQVIGTIIQTIIFGGLITLIGILFF